MPQCRCDRQGWLRRDLEASTAALSCVCATRVCRQHAQPDALAASGALPPVAPRNVSHECDVDTLELCLGVLASSDVDTLVPSQDWLPAMPWTSDSCSSCRSVGTHQRIVDLGRTHRAEVQSHTCCKPWSS